jgi:hypothetical protein
MKIQKATRFNYRYTCRDMAHLMKDVGGSSKCGDTLEEVFCNACGLQLVMLHGLPTNCLCTIEYLYWVY